MYYIVLLNTFIDALKQAINYYDLSGLYQAWTFFLNFFFISLNPFHTKSTAKVHRLKMLVAKVGRVNSCSICNLFALKVYFCVICKNVR